MAKYGNILMRGLIALASVYPSSLSLARVAEPAPEIKPWIDEYLQIRNKSLSTILPQSIFILAKDTSSLSTDAVITDSKALESLSPFYFIDHDSAVLTTKINRISTPEELSLQSFAGIIPANIIFTKTATKKPDLLVNVGGKVNRIKTVSRFPGTKRPEAVVSWIFKSLGYDGFVVAKKGNYFLVAGSRDLFQNGNTQALAIRDSESKLVLMNNKGVGIGLIQLQSSEGAFAIFKLLALAKNATEIPVGAKLLVQKSAENAQ